MKSRGPEPKSISGPANADAHITKPFPTGDYSFGSISIVSVSHATTLSVSVINISTTLCASSFVLTMVVPSICKFFNASFSPSCLLFFYSSGADSIICSGSSLHKSLCLLLSDVYSLILSLILADRPSLALIFLGFFLVLVATPSSISLLSNS